MLVKPIERLNIDAQQSTVEFASQNGSYNFILDNESSEFKGFKN